MLKILYFNIQFELLLIVLLYDIVCLNIIVVIIIN